MTRPIPSRQLRVLLWNVYVHHDAKHVRKVLTKLVERNGIDVVILSEAAHCFSVLDDIPGFTRYQAKPNGAAGRLLNEDGNTAILVRNTIPVLKSKPVRMHVPFKGAKAGLPHEPRVYHRVTIQIAEDKWRILGDHFPTKRWNAKAVAESKTFVRKFLSRSKGVPTIAAGDKNMSAADLRRATNSRVAGYKIDLAAFVNCSLVEARPLKKFRSDHHAVLAVFEKR